MSKYRESMKKVLGAHKVPIWLPYLQSIAQLGDDKFKFVYNGGETEANIKNISSIMLYGEYGTVDLKTIENICNKGVPLIIHRRNKPSPLLICTPLRPELKDTLTAQLIARQNKITTFHIARQILKAKFAAMRWLIPNVPSLPTRGDLSELRNIEASHARKYWNCYYQTLGCVSSRRRIGGYIKSALDAQSAYLSGIILRWITYHHLSPFHGFLHVQSDYPALIYDLIEPYRAHFEKIAAEQFQQVKDPDENRAVVAMVINASKEAVDELVYTGLTRQIVTRHELFHGIVLSLKNYLLKNQPRFLIPTVDKPNGGRPRKVVFRLYGRQAGKTNFWHVARHIAGKTA
jgi:CRISPR/Cas system-associated endonuclease Cas1